MSRWTAADARYMRLALRLARRAWGRTSPNPMVGAVLVKRGRVIGRGWHRRAGEPHAEIEALGAARARGYDPVGSTLYVTLEPCSTHGRTPPCTEAIVAAGIRRVVVAATDPNPKHQGRGFRWLCRAGVRVEHGLLAEAAAKLNRAFNHWVVRGVPWVTVKAAMTIDGKIATAAGESKWITGSQARAYAMALRQEADAILVGLKTVLADNPRLTLRGVPGAETPKKQQPLRIVLDTRARTPTSAALLCDPFAHRTLVVVGESAPRTRVLALQRQVRVLVSPVREGKIDLPWLLHRLGRQKITHLLVEGGGEVNASFLDQGLTQRVVFFYAPMILGGKKARRGVAGKGAADWAGIRRLERIVWKRLGDDLVLEAELQ